MSQNSTSSIRAYIIIMEFDEDPNDISIALGVQPTEVRRKGDSFLNGTLADTSYWIFESNLKSRDLDQHAQFLVSQLGKFSKLSSLLKKWRGEFRCVIEIGDEAQPSINLSSGILKQLGQMGCSFDLDYYVLPSGP